MTISEPGGEVVDLRRAKGEATRRILIESAIIVMAERGLEGTTFATIAEKSGLSRGLVTFHFKTKEQLITAALDLAAQIYEVSWNTHVRIPHLAPAERLATVIAHDVMFVRRHPAILSLWYTTWGEARGIYRDLDRAGKLTGHDREAALGEMQRWMAGACDPPRRGLKGPL